MNTEYMKRLVFGFVLVIVFAFGTNSAVAAEFRAPNRQSGGNLTLSTTETYRNLYTVGGTVIVNSTVQGDIYVAGGTVSIDGVVEQDVTVAGGTVSVNNKVGGDVRAVGGTMTINAAVSGDVVVAGGSLILSEKASVGGDVIVAGGTVTLDAPVNGYVRIMAGDATVNSAIQGDLTVRADNRIVFGEKAVVNGAAKVSGQTEPTVAAGARVPNLEFTKTNEERTRSSIGALLGAGLLIKLFASLIAALLLMYLWPRRSMVLVNATQQNFWSNVGVGLVAIIVTPIVGILLLVTVVGYYIALVVLSAFVLLLLIACLVATVFLGNWILGKLLKGKERHESWQVALVGVVAFILLGFIPILGWLVQAVLGLAAIGSISRHLIKAMREEKTIA